MLNAQMNRGPAMSKPRKRTPKPRPRSVATGQPYYKRRFDGVPRTRRSVMLDDELYEQVRALTVAPHDVYGTIGEAIEVGLKLLVKHHYG